MATENYKLKNNITIKLHWQFSHSSFEKLLNSAQDPLQSDKELKELIKKVNDECTVCIKYRKTPQRPIVFLSTATSFEEYIAMDLKFYKGRILLYFIETRLSLSSFVKSKEPEVILKAIFKSWICSDIWRT